VFFITEVNIDIHTQQTYICAYVCVRLYVCKEIVFCLNVGTHSKHESEYFLTSYVLNPDIGLILPI